MLYYKSLTSLLDCEPVFFRNNELISALGAFISKYDVVLHVLNDYSLIVQVPVSGVATSPVTLCVKPVSCWRGSIGGYRGMYNSHGSSIEGYPGMYSSTLVRGLIGGT